MRRSATIGVYDNFTTGQSSIPVWAADDEFTGWVDPPFRVGGQPLTGNNLANIGFNQGSDIIRSLVFVVMLCGQNQLGHLNGFAIFVPQ